MRPGAGLGRAYGRHYQGLVVPESDPLQPGMDVMSLPTPDDPGRAPVWDNYVVAQAVQACLGLLPRSALAVGVRVAGTDVELRFQLRELTEADAVDIDDIVSELEVLTGEHVHVDKTYEIRAEPAISPDDQVCWIFLARE
jgi:hypothetical protein